MDSVHVSARQADGPGRHQAPIADQETDVWWGSWSGWTMLPSLVLSIALTGVIAWWAWTYVDRRFVQLTIWALAGLVWLVQSVRWSWNWFGRNYRLTTRRLIVWRGHFRRHHRMTPLDRIEDIRVERYIHSSWTGVARIVIHTAGDDGDIVLEGIGRPEEVAALIRATRSPGSGAPLPPPT